jgi:hydroxypyruvate isomerase
MPKFAANLSTMFAELPFLERFAAARAAGFKAVEFQFPYDYAATDIAARLNDNGLALVLFNLPPGNFSAGERGIACHPDRTAEFARGIDLALAYAEALNCPMLNCLAGIKPHGLDDDEAFDALCDNLIVANAALASAGCRLVIEAINAVNMPGFFLNTSAKAMRAIAATSPNIRLQYDVYHMQRAEGELLPTLTRLMPSIGHIQIADAPLRHEPGTGEINFNTILSHIDAAGYEGWIGCEYTPRTTTTAGLHWLADHGVSL